jgi:hypothetical protein
MEKREPVWDDIKAFAAIGVVLSHVCAPFTHGEITANLIFANLCDTFSRPSVGIFFILSGMFALSKVDDFWASPDKTRFIGRYYLRQFVRVIIPAACAIIFYQVLIDGKQNALVLDSLQNFIAFFSFNNILSGSSYAIWFIYPWLFYSLWTPVLWVLLRLRSGRIILGSIFVLWLVLAVIVTSFYYYLGLEKAKIVVDFFNGSPTLKHLGYFLGGAYVTKAVNIYQGSARIRKLTLTLFKFSLVVTLTFPYILAAAGVDDSWHSYRDFERIHIVILTYSMLLLIRDFFETHPLNFELPNFPIYLSHVGFIWLLNPGIKYIENVFPIFGIVMEAILVLVCAYCFGRLYNGVAAWIADLLPRFPLLFDSRREAQVKCPRTLSPYLREEVFDPPIQRREAVEYYRTARFRTAVPIPSKVTMSLTNRCNCACRICGTRQNDFEERDVNFWLDLIKATVYPKIQYVLFGGEPTLYPGLQTLWQQAIDHNLDLVTITNGTNLEGPLTEMFLASNLRLTLSLDGFKEEHNQIRGNWSAFDSVMRFLLSAARTPDSFERIAVNCVMQPKNLEYSKYLLDFIDFLRRIGVKDIRLQHLQICDQRRQKATLSLWRTLFGKSETNIPDAQASFAQASFPWPEAVHVARLKEALTELKRRAENLYILPALSDADLSRYYDLLNEDFLDVSSYCLRPFKNPFVLPDGTISLCPLGGFKTPRLKNGDDFWSVWGSERAQAFRTALIEQGQFPICRHCCDNYQ